ncbi:MAG: oxidoreductase [Hyphomicrobiales bacterium]|nr:MAG: oxidoreductase [Hyphomicrobiales bacterium]
MPREEILRRARAITPLIISQADAIEAGKDITEDVRQALWDSRLFWIYLPPELGGCGADVTTAIEVMEEIAYADGAAGWTYFCNISATAVAMAFGSEETVDALFRGDEPAVLCGTFAPMGHAVPVDGGYMVSGRQQYASGSANATWAGSGYTVYDTSGAPILDSDGSPQTLGAFLPKAGLHMAGNWDVMGLVGSGSYDYEIPEQFVPMGLTVDSAKLTKPACGPIVYKRGSALFRIGTLELAHIGHSAVMLGIAKRAMAEVVRLLSSKTRPGYAGPVVDNEPFRQQFGMLEANYWAVRERLISFFAGLEADCAAGRTLSEEQYARCIQIALHTHRVTKDIVSSCYEWSGSAGFRNPSVIGRCMRDALVACNHIVNDPIGMQGATSPIIKSWQ